MKKSSSESTITLGQVMRPTHANILGNVFGGELLKIMDSVAYAVAIKHVDSSNVVTQRIDEIIFRKPIHIGAIVQCTGKAVFTEIGRASCRERVS